MVFCPKVVRVFSLKREKIYTGGPDERYPK
jgi:hypothetical protein